MSQAGPRAVERLDERVRVRELGVVQDDASKTRGVRAHRLEHDTRCGAFGKDLPVGETEDRGDIEEVRPHRRYVGCRRINPFRDEPGSA